MTYNPLNILRRRARAKGFGVHSPFAYKFITEVLSEHLCYYDYDKLTDRRDRTLYRIAAYFCPMRVLAPHPDDADAVFMACGKATSSGVDSCDMAVFSSANEADTIYRCIDRQCNVILIEDARSLLSSVKHHLQQTQSGMLFDNASDMCVIVPNHKLPRQDFELKF